MTTGPERSVTVAGLLALGIYPQQYLPNCVIQASAAAKATDPTGTRATDARRFDGPIPLILDETLHWVLRNTRTRIRFSPEGQVRDEPEFPIEAVRELLSNALIHRDLGPYALTQAITLKLDERQLLLGNPGGLWGITVDRLGKTGVTSARNGHLLRICQNIRTGEGNRVVEALASGIPAVLGSLSAAGMVPPRFHDQGIRFSVVVPNHALLAPDDLRWLATIPARTPLSDRQRHALVAMRHGRTWTNQSLREMFPMDSREARQELTGLVTAGVATAEGERGGRTYRLANHLTAGGRGQELDVPSNAVASSQPAGPHSRQQRSAVTRRAGSRSANAAHLVARLESGPQTLAELITATELSPRQVKYALQQLRDTGTVVLHGKRGQTDSRYALRHQGQDTQSTASGGG